MMLYDLWDVVIKLNVVESCTRTDATTIVCHGFCVFSPHREYLEGSKPSVFPFYTITIQANTGYFPNSNQVLVHVNPNRTISTALSKHKMEKKFAWITVKLRHKLASRSIILSCDWAVLILVRAGVFTFSPYLRGFSLGAIKKTCTLWLRTGVSPYRSHYKLH